MPTDSNTGSPRLLLVAPDGQFAWQLRPSLHRRGIVCRIRATAEQALSALDEPGERFDVVVLDGSVPGVDQLRVYARLRGEPTGARVPILFSRSPFASDGSDTLGGPDVYVARTATPDTVAERVRMLLPARREDPTSAGPPVVGRPSGRGQRPRPRLGIAVRAVGSRIRHLAAYAALATTVGLVSWPIAGQAAAMVLLADSPRAGTVHHATRMDHGAHPPGATAGRVVAEGTGRPFGEASVRLRSDRAALAEADGNDRLTDVSTGIDDLRACAAGLAAATPRTAWSAVR